MDAKLARGYAREGRRQDQKLNKIIVSGNDAIGDVAGLEIELRRKISSRRLRQLTETTRSFRHNVVFLRLGQSSPGWGSSTNVQISGSFTPLKVPFEGRWENASRYQIEVTILNRRSYDRREEAKIFFIREHAIKRYIERSNAKYDDVFADLWPAVLLPTLMSMIGTDVPQEIALPVKDGMFLGTYSGADHGGMSVVTRKGHVRGRALSDHRLHVPHEPATWMHTYISFDEMRDQQAALWLRLTRFLAEHAEAMIDWHALGPLTYAFGDDRLNIWPNIACPDPALRQFRQIYTGEVWRRALSRQSRPTTMRQSNWSAGPGRVSLPRSAWAIALPSVWSPPRPVLPKDLRRLHPPT